MFTFQTTLTKLVHKYRTFQKSQGVVDVVIQMKLQTGHARTLPRGVVLESVTRRTRGSVQLSRFLVQCRRPFVVNDLKRFVFVVVYR